MQEEILPAFRAQRRTGKDGRLHVLATRALRLPAIDVISSIPPSGPAARHSESVTDRTQATIVHQKVSTCTRTEVQEVRPD